VTDASTFPTGACAVRAGVEIRAADGVAARLTAAPGVPPVETTRPGESSAGAFWEVALVAAGGALALVILVAGVVA
jgi:hypothetical protein